MTPPLLQVDDLTIGVRVPGAGVRAVVGRTSLSLGPGESIGIAGESGCGKSTLLLAMMGIVKPGLAHAGGSITFRNQPMLGQPEPALEAIRGGKMALIPQNAGTALTPTLRIGDQIEESLRLHTDLGAEARQSRIVDLLARVRLPDPKSLVRRFPHELSGGQVQRAAIAMALAGEPELLLLDEPTTGLDVTTQLGILELLADLRRDTGVAFVCVSHDLGVLARLADRVAVMYAGAVIETGSAAAVLREPAHPYTRALLGSIPRLTTARLPNAIPGRPPSPGAMPTGCRYTPRCSHAADDCRSVAPVLADTAAGSRAACFHPQSGPIGLAAEAPARARAAGDSILLNLDAVSVSYARRGLLDLITGAKRPRPTVDAVTLDLRKGEILGLVGESGSGKSTILRAISGLWPPSAGTIRLAGIGDLGKPVAARDGKALRAIQLVFQNPDASLNPRQTIAEILAQPLRLYFRLSAGEIRERASRLLAEVRLDDSYLERLPGQLSGGERQRVAIARAFAAEPDILLCDEVTSALDVSVQASVLRLLSDLSARRGVATILVSHDLAVVEALADRIAVLYRGHVVEIGPARSVCREPRHPYTRALISAVLEPAPGAPQRLGRARDGDDVVSNGCPFAGRCLERIAPCLTTMPDWSEAGTRARCHFPAAATSLRLPEAETSPTG